MRLAQVMTLRFLGREQAHSARDAVTLQQGADLRANMATLHEVAGGFEDTGDGGGADRARGSAG